MPGRARNVGCVLVVISALIAASCADERELISDAGVAQDSSFTPDSSDAMPAASCSVESDAYPAGTTSDAIMHDGSMRTFRIHVPPSYDGEPPAPLVLMLHGGGGSGRQFQEASAGMDPIADREGFITLYPDGSGVLRTWNGGGCCGYAVTDQVDDVGFIAALLDHVEAALCIDRRRVFATGMSNGGIMSHRLACELADRIAAIVPVAGTDMTASCSPSRPVPVMQIHGTDDGHVPWEGGQGCGPAGAAFTSVPDTMQRWSMRNACGATVSPYFEQGDGSCEVYGGCEDGADVVLCALEGGGHNWPAGAPPAGLVECPGNGGQSRTFLASEAVWSFFAAHPMASAP